MQQLQATDRFEHRFVLAQIANYRSLQDEHREALGEIDNGIRHFDPRPGGRMIETTEQFRQDRLNAIADLERWVRVWKRDLVEVN